MAARDASTNPAFRPELLSRVLRSPCAARACRLVMINRKGETERRPPLGFWLDDELGDQETRFTDTCFVSVPG